MIALLHDNHNPDQDIGIIPWWYRIFYLHVAGTIILCSMLRTDLYTTSVSQSWSKLLSILHGHEHLSPFIQQAVTNFHASSCKILDSQPSLGEAGEKLANAYLEDFFSRY